MAARSFDAWVHRPTDCPGTEMPSRYRRMNDAVAWRIHLSCMPPRKPKPIGISPSQSEGLPRAEIEAEPHRIKAAPVASLGAMPVRHARIGEAVVKLGRRLDVSAIHDDMRFDFPFLAWDAWVILHQVAKESVLRNKDGTLPARWLKGVGERLAVLPQWLGFDLDLAIRVLPSLAMLDHLGLLVASRGRSTAPAKLAISLAGEGMLKAGRLAFFEQSLSMPALDSLHPVLNSLSPRATDRANQLHWMVGVPRMDYRGLGRLLAIRILETLPAVGAVRSRDMERVFAPSDPFIPDVSRPWAERRIEVPLETYLDRIPMEDSRGFLIEGLVPACTLGLVARGIDAEGHITWSLSASGRKWVGLPPDPRPPHPRHLKVTPAFDVFLGRVDSQVLAEVSLYAEPTGQDHGMVARFTRASIQRAFEIGITTTEIVASLESLAAADLPANIRTALDDWARASQPVRIREGILLQCSDVASAGTLERLVKEGAERIGDTTLFLADRKILNALRRKASDAGIFL